MHTPGKQLKNLLHNEGAMLDVAKKATEDQRESMNTPDVKKYVQKLWLGRVHDLEFEKQVAKVLTTAIEEARKERDREIVEVIGHLPYVSQEEYEKYRKGGVIKWITLKEHLTNSQPSTHYQPKAN